MAPSIKHHHKGLLNGPGQNNCFLNSAVQVLWHLDIFRRSFRELSGHACMADSCIFCALKDLFGQLQFSHERALPPDALRKALAQSFSDQHRFQLGFMDDAAECFENILLRIHFHIAYNEAEDMCNAKHCIPHQKFAMTLVEQSVCGVCHATSEPLPFTQMVHYVSASALISQAKQVVGASHPDLFGQLLKNAGGMGDIRDCPSSCGAKIQIRRTLINRPEIVSVGIVWDSDRPSLEHIMSLLDTLRIHLRLSDVFHGSFDTHHGDNVYHELVGVVTYYGKHYSTFFFHTKLRVWVYFDDANVREVGPHWEHVVEKCRRGRYQPLLLLFATPNGTPIDASQAPKSITLVDKPAINMQNGHGIVGKAPMQRCSLSPIGSSAMGGRRSITPSPEKPPLSNDVSQRRAVTPTPDQSAGQLNGKPVLPNNDYQNLIQFQEAIFNRSPMCDGLPDRRQDLLEKHGIPMRKELVRRDSGNWSGDRNSASSSSSTSLENPYHYIIGKMHLRAYGGVPKSPNKNGDLSSGSGNSSGGPADPGYDSFSLSSTDSIPIQQNLKYNFQLAQIPEGHQTPTNANHLIDENARVADDCERLCAEVDQLLDRSEQAEDLITALSLCNAAVNKARAAMDAPYSNPQTASFATMKHNACVLRARSLHRKLEEPLHNNLKYGETRHSREGSGCSGRGSAGSHSRQNSKDKGSHSRQNSQELLNIQASPSPPAKLSPELKPPNGKISPSKNIEIYATLPKNKKGLLSRSSSKIKSTIEDEEYVMKERTGRSLLGNRSKVASKKEIEKRTRSEERNTKNVKEIAPVVSKEKEQKEQKKQAKLEEKQNKKQHKIRRKLLMGGLMRRKNRSMPDLRDDEGMAKESPKTNDVKEVSKDDSMVNSKTAIQPNLNGYLSEGNLEYSANPNLERSKLMRKSFHGSKLLPFNKVPPPPPLRTTSQLSKANRMANETKPETAVYANNRQWCQEPASLPFLPRDVEKPKTDAITYSNGGYLLQQPPAMNTVVTEAQIHHEASFQSLPPSIDEPDFVNKIDDHNFQLPPYPSPIHSTVHSRQASEEFPPPPATLPPPEQESNFLYTLQEKCDKLARNATVNDVENKTVKSSGGESWLKELQAKQAERRKNDQREHSFVNADSKNVKDLKSKFEQLTTDEVDYILKSKVPDVSGVETVKSSSSDPRLEKFEPTLGNVKNSILCEEDKNEKRKNGKKKNVTFCEQVVLVATADDEEADSYIPNPILERVLRTVLHKESNSENREHAVHSVVPLKRTDSWRLSKGLPLKPYSEGEDVVDGPSTNGGRTNVINIANGSCLEGVDEVDAPCPVSQPQSRPLQNSYVNSQAYSPTYIPASSLCAPPKNNEHRVEYPEPASLPEPSSLQNGYDSFNDQNPGGSAHLPPRKFNECYPNSEHVRYSPVCNQDVPLHNGYHSAYSAYPCTTSTYQNSAASSYQPMSLQYYPTQNRSSPQISGYRDQINHSKLSLQNGCHLPSSASSSPSSSLTRQNSNVSHYNKQLPPTDPRRAPVSSISPPNSLSSSSRLSDCQRSLYYNMQQFGQKLGNGNVPGYTNGNGSPYGCNEVSKSSQSSAGINSTNLSNGSQNSPTPPYQHYLSNSTNQNLPTSSMTANMHYSMTASSSNTNQYSGSSHLSQSNQYSSNSPLSSHYLPNPSHPSNSLQNHTSQYSNHSNQYTPPANHSNQYSPNTNSSVQHLPPSSVHQHMPHQNLPSHMTNATVHQNGHSSPSYTENVSRNSAPSISPYQSIPHNSNAYEMHARSTYNAASGPYQSVPYNSTATMSSNQHQTMAQQHRSSLPPVYQHPPPPPTNSKPVAYQRVPTPNQQNRPADYIPPPSKYSPYQPPPIPKQMDVKKPNTFVPCNLCRKKQISPPSVYCNDCDFYISRFKQK